ncbi:MAG: amidohydrolase family protein [Anaerovoracaceae bacterium]
MKIDGHIRVGSTFKGEDFPIEEYIKLMEEENIDKAVICPNKPSSYKVEDGNDYVATVLAKYPDKFWGAVRVNPWDREKAILELEKRVIENEKIKFLYLNPWEEQFQCNDKLVYGIMEAVQKLKLSVIIEAGYPWVSQIFQIADLARNFKDVKFIATNSGQLDLSGSTLGDVAFVMGKSDNIYLGSAGACGGQWLADIEREYPGKILFESNYPFMEPHLENFRIEKGFMEDNEKENIYSNNILAML